ncbi:MAG TPA: thermonuclease family protein [Trueperaceae bacterium]|nr:thermonuclease family protein [Trueperaceae bacterium]
MRPLFVVASLILLGSASAQLVPIGALYGPVPVLVVTDGDTLVVESNAGPRTVRLIGIDAPERGQSTSVGTAFAAQASAFLGSLLPAGTLVWLELDQGTVDSFGRLLAYVYVGAESGEWVIGDVRVRQVNLALAEAGLASVLTVPPNDAYEDLYRVAVEQARAEGRGMWGGAPVAGVAGTAGVATDSGPVPVAISCALYNPDTPNDADGEWVSLLVEETYDTTGLYLYDEGSKNVFLLPAGVQEPGEIRVGNPGQGVWNNGGDVIYLMRGAEVVDVWDYSGRLAVQGRVECRGR